MYVDWIVVGYQGFMASVWSWGDQGLTALNVGSKKAVMEPVELLCF